MSKLFASIGARVVVWVRMVEVDLAIYVQHLDVECGQLTTKSEAVDGGGGE